MHAHMHGYLYSYTFVESKTIEVFMFVAASMNIKLKTAILNMKSIMINPILEIRSKSYICMITYIIMMKHVISNCNIC